MIRNELKCATACIIVLLPIFAAAQNQNTQAPAAASAAPAPGSTGSKGSRDAAVRELAAQQRAALDAIRGDKSLTPEERQSKIDATVKDFRARRKKLMKSSAPHP